MGKRTGISLKDGLAANRAARRAGFKENTADYDVAMSANTAGAGNLSRQLSRLGKGLAGANARTETSLARQVAAAKAASRRTTAAEGKTVRAYGTALAGTAHDAFAPAAARSAADVAKARAAATQGATVSRLGGIVAGIAAEGATAQQAAGEYALAQAYAARNALTASDFAQLQGDLYKTAYGYQQQWELWKKQQDYAEKQAKKEGVKGVGRLANEAPTIMDATAARLQELRDQATDTNHPITNMDVTATATQIAQENGWEPGSAQYALIVKTLLQVKNAGANGGSMNIGDAFNSAIDILYAGKEGKEWREGLRESITTYASMYHQDDHERVMFEGDDAGAAGGSGGGTPVGEVHDVGNGVVQDSVGNFWRRENGKWVRV